MNDETNPMLETFFQCCSPQGWSTLKTNSSAIRVRQGNGLDLCQQFTIVIRLHVCSSMCCHLFMFCSFLGLNKPLQSVVLHENVSPGIPVTIDSNIAPASRVNQGISLHLCYRFKIVVCVTHAGVYDFMLCSGPIRILFRQRKVNRQVVIFRQQL